MPGEPAEKLADAPVTRDDDAVFWRLRRDAPPHWTVQRIGGLVCMNPRPRFGHGRVQRAIGGWTHDFFEETNPRRRGPGGWIFTQELDLLLGAEVLVPDLVGWRRERAPTDPDAALVTIAPDWACEVLSPSTEAIDRGPKSEAYAANGVPWLWIVDREERCIEVFRRDGARMVVHAVARADATVPLAPFDAVPLGLAELWA